MTSQASKKYARRTLKGAIGESGRKQRAIALQTGIPEVRLSKIVTRRDAADDRERRKLSAVLGRPESELFEEAVA